MCTPLLLIAGLSLATTAAGSAIQYTAQQQQASAQNAMAESNAKSAAASFRLQQSQLQSQLIQQRSQVEQQDVAQTIDAERAKATARASAAGQGLSGVSLDSIVGQTDRERALQSAVLDRNFQTLQTDELNKEGNAYYQMKNQMNSVSGGVFPSLLTPVLATAAAGLSAYSSYLYSPKSNYGAKS